MGLQMLDKQEYNIMPGVFLLVCRMRNIPNTLASNYSFFSSFQYQKLPCLTKETAKHR